MQTQGTESIGRLPSERLTAVRDLFAAGPSGASRALEAARDALSGVAPDDLLEAAERCGELCLSVGHYAGARDVFTFLTEAGPADDPAAQARRLATALDGLGDTPGAREVLIRAAAAAREAGDNELFAAIAVQHALPADWFSGDVRVSGLLQLAETLDLPAGARAAVLAARALTEIRIPSGAEGAQQLAWVTLPAVSQPLADTALDLAGTEPDETRCLALLAWRAVHRGPRWLDRRRQTAAEAMDIAQRLRNLPLLVEAGVFLAVDALESGDLPLHERACKVVRWAADNDANPRLRWRSELLLAGRDHRRGDIESARARRQQATEIGLAIGHPGWFAAEMLLTGEEVITVDDPAAMTPYLFDDSFVGLESPLGRACIAYLFARNGDPATAARHARISLDQLEEEASYLFLATRCAHVALQVCDADLLQRLTAILEPWGDRVAVDSHGWWCDGPVADWRAQLHDAQGNPARARHWLAIAEPIAAAIGDVRSRQRLQRLGARLDRLAPAEPPTDPAAPAHGLDLSSLSPRELTVLRLIAAGRTNAQIATELAYSLSTIRAETMTIYRKLGVRGRAGAAARAVAAGLTAPA